jgi:Flp pilus assembly pilin Flp
MARELHITACEQTPTGRKKRKKEMHFIRKMMVRLTEAKRNQAGQTMTEYVLIIAAIAVAGYIAYQGLETGINGVITKVTASLNAA